MATKTIAWATGSGNITLTYTGQGNGSISVSSDENDSFDDRQQSFSVVTTNGSPEKAVSILVKQRGKRYDVGHTFEFDYTGTVQQVTLPKGRYKLQCWGAQGGNVTGSYAVNGSKGGYSEGVLTLTEKTTLYVFVGGQGTSYTSSASQTSTSVVKGGWNGGGAGVRTSRYSSSGEDGRSFPRGGGGATDISTVTSAMSYSSGRTTRDNASLLARCIVAGGGAGASARYTSETTTSSGSWSTVNTSTHTTSATNGSSSRGVQLTAGVKYRCSAVITSGSGSITECQFYTDPSWSPCGSTFTPSSSGWYILAVFTSPGGLTVKTTLERYNEGSTSTSTSSGKSNTSMQGGGTSGKGQYPGKATSAGNGGGFGLGANQSSTNYRYCGGGGGGGWYGGGTNQSDSSASYVSYSGGGSGFVNTSANASSRPSGYTGLQLDSGTTTAGNSSFESVIGSTETGHSGNGYARITVIE